MCGSTRLASLVLPPPPSHVMRLRSLTTIALCAAALPAAPAHAFTVSPQAEIRPPARFPVALAGGFEQGERIPKGHVLLRRSVGIRVDEGKRKVRFRCPGGRRIRTLGLNDPSNVGVEVPKRMRKYTRRTRLTLNAYAASTLVEPGETARGRIYVLCGRR